MNKFETFVKTLETCDVYFKRVNDTEIVIPAPLTHVPYNRTQEPFVNVLNEWKEGKIDCASGDDETAIHVAYNEKWDSLDWSILCGRGEE